MPSGLKRFQKAESLQFITFSCFHRLPLLEAPGAREAVEAVLEQTPAPVGPCPHSASHQVFR
jgi:putative transposase